MADEPEKDETTETDETPDEREEAAETGETPEEAHRVGEFEELRSLITDGFASIRSAIAAISLAPTGEVKDNAEEPEDKAPELINLDDLDL